MLPIRTNELGKVPLEGKFFGRLVAKETSVLANSSSARVYYGNMAAGEVPFVWESRPGTPKHPISSTALPPLTPPPSYLSNSTGHNRKKKKHRIISGCFLFPISVLPKLAVKKCNVSFSSSPFHASSPNSSSSSSSLVTGSCPDPSLISRRRTLLMSQAGKEEDGQNGGSPTSTLCCGIGYNVSNGVHRCYNKALVKKAPAFLSSAVLASDRK